MNVSDIVDGIKEVSWEDHGFKNNWCSSSNGFCFQLKSDGVLCGYNILHKIIHDQEFPTSCYCLNVLSDAILHFFITLATLNQYLKDTIVEIIVQI